MVETIEAFVHEVHTVEKQLTEVTQKIDRLLR